MARKGTHALIRFAGWLWSLRRQYVAPGEQPTQEQVNHFYDHEWPRVRYEAIKRFRAAGEWRCGACNRTQADKAVICVDHIKPVRRYWHLRKVQSNLQPLCRLCNYGKGSWDETDWQHRSTGVLGWFRR